MAALALRSERESEAEGMIEERGCEERRRCVTITGYNYYPRASDSASSLRLSADVVYLLTAACTLADFRQQRGSFTEYYDILGFISCVSVRLFSCNSVYLSNLSIYWI